MEENRYRLPQNDTMDMVAEYHSKYRTKTDEELEAELSKYPSWDEKEHPDLSAVDYKQYKHKKSPRTIKAISKWL